MTHELIGKKVLVTTTGWFIAPDGKQYRALFGTLKAVSESSKTLGFSISRNHTNYFFEIGKMKLMGCQVLYMIECESVNQGSTTTYTEKDGKAIEYSIPTTIYVTE
jgi:hypothetical protein